jgi:hypothetical protein
MFRDDRNGRLVEGRLVVVQRNSAGQPLGFQDDLPDRVEQALDKLGDAARAPVWGQTEIRHVDGATDVCRTLIAGGLDSVLAAIVYLRGGTSCGIGRNRADSL